MAGYILKYSAGTYQRKISALEGYYSQLVTHLEQLNTLQGQMKDFWDGSASSAEYMNLISDKINEVKNRMEDCKNTNIQYQQVVDDMANAGSTVDNIVSDVKDASKAATDAAGAAASIVGLIV